MALTKQQARHRLNYAVRIGKVIKPARCKCGALRVEAHHSDYAKPLEVTWCCSKCHKQLHPNVYLPLQCPKGHLYAGDNLHIAVASDGYTRRHCKTCNRAHSIKYWRAHDYSKTVQTRRRLLKD